jgi:TonB family protein
MSASDSNGYFVELGEYNLIIARATLGQRPRTIDAVQEVWLGDAPGIDTALGKLRPAGSNVKAVALLRLKNEMTFLADSNQAKNIVAASAVESFLGGQLGAENLPASWAWVNASNGQAPQNGARWALNAASAANTEEALGKLRGWSFELVRCQSASLTLAGGLSTAAHGTPVLLLEISEAKTSLIAITNQGIAALATVPVGFDALAGTTQTALGLKFRGSAARLMFNESYDFGETASSIVEPLANAVKNALSSLGGPAPAQLVCSGILARQTWIAQALAKALNLAPFTLDAAAWAGARGLSFGGEVNAANVSSSWLGVLNAAASYDPATPGAAKAWNPLLTGTPVASSQVVPAIIIDTPKAATPPPIAKPAVIPAIIQEPPKSAVPPKPTTPAIQPKPAVIITPPSKPGVVPAKPGTTVIPPQAKPAEVKPATPPAKPAPASPAKPAPTPVSAAKPPGKPEPAKPTSTAKPAPAPVLGAKPATAAPFPPKKNNMALIIGILAAVVIIGAVFFVVSNNKAKAEQAEKELRIKKEAEAKINAEARARAEAEKKAEEERLARQKELEQAELRLKNAQEEARQQQEAARNSLLFGRGSFTMATEPTGATVTIGELSPKTSPVSMKDMRLGTYAVVITLSGYDTEHRDIEIKEKENTDLGTIVLKRQVGTVELTSDPSSLSYELKPAGALFVNPSDVHTGQTPATLTGIPAGSYQVTINRPNWTPYTSTVTIERNATVKVNGDFPGGTVVITSSPSGAIVSRENNQASIGTTPLTLNGIAPGTVNFTVNQRGYDPVTVTGKLEGGKTLTLSATLLDSDRVMKLSELDERPSPIGQADPDLSSTQRSEGGTAIISFVVGRDGIPTDLKIEQASSSQFGKACIVAAAKWRFRPGVVHGKPVRSKVSIPFKIGPE